MTIDSFAEYLIAHVQTNLPGNYCDATFTIIHNTKPGNRKATGIGICKPISDIAPCIYIDELYAQYSKGMNLTALTNAFAKLIMNFEQIAFCASQWPLVRLPVATWRYEWPEVNRLLCVRS